MAETHVLSALTKKRSEFLGTINYDEKYLKESRASLASLDETIHLFNPNYDLRTIKAKRHVAIKYFNLSEAKTAILGLLRTVSSPISTVAIAETIANERGFDMENGFCMPIFQKTIQVSLRSSENKDIIECAGKDGLSLLWQIKGRGDQDQR